jgi:ATP-dependent Lhr-like helicase
MPEHDQLRVINAADPLNLGGIITAGVKTPSKAGNRILLENGAPAARLQGDEIELLSGAKAVTEIEAERKLRIVVGARPFFRHPGSREA